MWLLLYHPIAQLLSSFSTVPLGICQHGGLGQSEYHALLAVVSIESLESAGRAELEYLLDVDKNPPSAWKKAPTETFSCLFRASSCERRVLRQCICFQCASTKHENKVVRIPSVCLVHSEINIQPLHSTQRSRGQNRSRYIQ